MKLIRKKAADTAAAFKQKTKQNRTPLFDSLKIAHRLLAGFLVIAFLCAAMGGYTALNLQQLGNSTEEMYANGLLPIRNIAKLQKLFQVATGNLREVLLSTDEHMIPIHLDTIMTSLDEIPSTIDKIDSLTTDQRRYEVRLRSLREAFDYYQTLMLEKIGGFKAGRKLEIIDELYSLKDLRKAELAVQSSIESIEQAIDKDVESVYSENVATSQSVFLLTMITIIAVIFLAILIGILMSRGISKPIKRLTGRVKQLAAGDTDFEIGGKTAKDEVGQMQEAVGTILSAIKALTDDTNMLIEAAAKGQLSVRADTEKHRGAYRGIVEGINTTLDAMIAPINESAAVLGELSQGNLNVRVESDFTGDFAIIKNALNGTAETLKGYIGEISGILGYVSDGILTNSIASDFKGDFAALKESINKSIDAFNGVLKNISVASEEVAAGAAHLSGGSQVISQGAIEQASALEQLTVSISEIAEKTGNNAKSAAQSNTLSLAAMEHAEGGNEKMRLLQKAMEEINASSASISKIIKVIDDIAFQTHILALNAAVEAASAGVHGKGFAVVADEVRNLAAKSAQAAQETAALIEGSIAKTAAGTRIVDETAAALHSIAESIEETAALSGEIAAASSEQAAGIAQVDKGIEQLSNVMQSSSATAQQAAASSEELAAQADQLKRMAGRFRFRQGEKDAEITQPHGPGESEAEPDIADALKTSEY